MWKEKIRLIRDFIVKHSKIAFPILVIAAVAITVVFALNIGNKEEKAEEPETLDIEVSGEAVPEEEILTRSMDEPLELNTDPALVELVTQYYDALARGDLETIAALSNYVDETDEIRTLELSKYFESYPFIEIYTKPGPEIGSYVAYVYSKVKFYAYDELVPGSKAYYICTDENGSLYFNMGEVSDEVRDYVKVVSEQEDVLELHIRVNAECTEIYANNLEIFDYICEVEREVSKATGEILASQFVNGEPGEGEEGNEGGPEEAPVENPEGGAETPAAGPMYATATTTVNVRSSDSEQADKVDKVPGGSRVQVIEQKPNGWSQVSFTGENGNVNGFIKSEFLEMEALAVNTPDNGESTPDAGASTPENVDTSESIGTVTATVNLNIRASASEDAERVGFAVGGDTLELLSKENGWCKVRYNDLVGYVKEDFVQ